MLKKLAAVFGDRLFEKEAGENYTTICMLSRIPTLAYDTVTGQKILPRVVFGRKSTPEAGEVLEYAGTNPTSLPEFC